MYATTAVTGSALRADVPVGIGPDEKSTLGVAGDRDRLAVRAPEIGGGAQQDESLIVRGDGVGSAGGTRVAERFGSSGSTPSRRRASRRCSTARFTSAPNP